MSVIGVKSAFSAKVLALARHSGGDSYYPEYLDPFMFCPEVTPKTAPFAFYGLSSELALEVQAPLSIDMIATVRAMQSRKLIGRPEGENAISSLLICPEFFAFPEAHRPSIYSEEEWLLHTEALGEAHAKYKAGEGIEPNENDVLVATALILGASTMTVDVSGAYCPYCGFRRPYVVIPIDWTDHEGRTKATTIYNQLMSDSRTISRDAYTFNLNPSVLVEMLRGAAIESLPLGTIDKFNAEMKEIKRKLTEAERSCAVYRENARKAEEARQQAAKKANELAELNGKLDDALAEAKKEAKAQTAETPEGVSLEGLEEAQGQVVDLAYKVMQKYGAKGDCKAIGKDYLPELMEDEDA